MSSKYNQHPMEKKAESDITATRMERQRIEASYFRWLEFYHQSNHLPVDGITAFRAGWIEAMDEIKRSAPRGEKA